MAKLKMVCIFLVFIVAQTLHCLPANAQEFIKKEAIYSTKSGKRIGELSFSIEIKFLNANTKTFYLVIGERGSEIIGSGGKNKTLWIFGKNTNAGQLIKTLKKDDYILDVKNYRDFVPFSGNEIYFELKDCEEISKQIKIPFSTDDPLGQTVTLKLQFYIASKDKKKTLIDDDAKVSLKFTIPTPPKGKSLGGALIDFSGGSVIEEEAGGGGGAAAAAEQSAEEKAEEKEELLKKAKEAERIKRTNDLNIFITVKNEEIVSLTEAINALLSDKDAKVSEQTTDSIELVLNELQKKVDYWDKGYTDILLNEEAIQDKFLKFNTEKTIATKKLGELRQKQLEKNNWLKKLGIAFAALMGGWMLFMQIWNPIKMKRQMKKQQKKMEAEVRKRAFENIDINTLDKI